MDSLSKQLSDLKAKATDSDLAVEGHYFYETCNDYAQCSHGECAYPTTSVDGELVALLWNNYRSGDLVVADTPSFLQIWQMHQAWSYETFGLPEIKGPIGPLKHMKKEVDEAIADPSDVIEFADLLFLLMDAARRAGHGPQDLLNGCAKKLEILKTREYTPDLNNPDEPVEHNREGECYE